MVVSNSPAIKCRVLVFFKWYVNHRVLLHFLTRRSSDLWHPLRAMVDARAPVRLAVDRATVRRGDSVTVTGDVPAATRAILWTRGPGEPWRAAPGALDSIGHAPRRIGPPESDLYLRAPRGSRRSIARR